MPVEDVSITHDQQKREPKGKKKKKRFLSYLVVDVVEYIFPERIQNGRGHEKSTHAHPETICKRH